MKSNKVMTSTKTCIVIIIIKNDYTKACSESNNKPFLVQMKVDESQKTNRETKAEGLKRKLFNKPIIVSHKYVCLS